MSKNSDISKKSKKSEKGNKSDKSEKNKKSKKTKNSTRISSIPDEITSAIKSAGVDVVLQLPCDRIAALLHTLSSEVPYVSLTREEEGVGIAAGVALAGGKPLMVVQSSGVGNMVNALLSLTKFYRLPLPVIISHRGVYKENIAAQVPVGANLTRILDGMDIDHATYSKTSDLKGLQRELENIYKNNEVKCLLFSPKLFEGLPKDPLKPSMPVGNQNVGTLTGTNGVNNINDGVGLSLHVGALEQLQVQAQAHSRNGRVKSSGIKLPARLQHIKEMKGYLTGKTVICNMGFPARELYSVLDQSSNFYMLGSLGLASSIALGVAMFTSPENEVVVIDGDGSLLMNPNALISIGAFRPVNLTIICIDNMVYGSTGNQPTLSASGFRLDELAMACRIPNVIVTDRADTVSEFRCKGPTFFRVLAKAGNGKVGTIALTQHEIRDRFMAWLKKKGKWLK